MRYANVLFVSALLLGCAGFGAEEGKREATERPAKWAQPMKVEGVPNLHKVDASLYRSAQPTAEGARRIEAQGVTRVVNLRAFHSDADKLAETDLESESVAICTWRIKDVDVVAVLKILKKSEGGPYLIHCKHGADRTGLMCAMYRIVIQGWSKEEAVKEMVDGGYGFHSIWSNIVSYVREVDVEKIKKRVGE